MRVFDIESDGLLPGVNRDGEMLDDDRTITRVHCINAFDRREGREYRFTDNEFYQDLDGERTDVPCPRDGTVEDGIRWLIEDGHVGGHNIIGYDVPALAYLYPQFDWDGVRMFDSNILGKLACPTLRDTDFAQKRKGKLTADFPAGSQKLMHWAQRVGKNLKTDFNPEDYGHTWKTMPFTKDFDDYCMDDVRANVDVIEFQEERLASCPDAVELETAVAQIIKWQERVGVRFDVVAAEALAESLYVRLHELEEQARESFAPFYLPKGKMKTYKKDMKRKTEGGWLEHISAGAQAQPIKLILFNPGSRQQIENRLRAVYNWEPTEFTDTGLAKIDEEVLGTLPFKEAKVISEYMTVAKRLSQLVEGKQAWLKAVKPDGRIYGRVDQLGTGTGRMSHFGPNLAQVPKCGKPYGAECRALFIADDGRTIVGCDADALELRILAHFLARFDAGEYVQTVLAGSKEDGTDMHSRNRAAIGLALRDTAKTWFYAFIYGAGDFKLGSIVISEWDEEKLTRFYTQFPPGRRRRAAIIKLGRRSRDRLQKKIPAFGRLIQSVHKAAERGYVKGLDGRRIPIRAIHSALNFICQGAGALAMKKALVIMFEKFKKEGLDVHPLLNVHDEVQLSVLPEEADHVGRIASESICRAGEFFALRCPLTGDYDIGPTWAETH
jgi:DNA polymerase I-like protein with 3'-5' exonuclease and polymerase domains